MSDQRIDSDLIDEPEIVDSLEEILASPTPQNLSLEALVLLVNTERLKSLHETTQSEFRSLRTRQEQVRQLHNLMKSINAKTTTTGEFDCSNDTELQGLLNNSRVLGVEFAENKYKYTKDECARLLDNIRVTVDDLNVQNDMQLQAISRLTNERYESYQMARSILKPLHDDKVNKARAIANR